jgi:lipoate-protein ligase A
MAVDESLMESVRQGGPPVLRFYDWEPACLSIGYFQAIAAVNSRECCRRGIDIVRRPTGGNAILHQGCLTYSVALPVSSPLVDGGIVSSYRRLSRPFQETLLEFGAPVVPAPASVRPVAGFDCFAAPGPYEITLAGRKILGSAQTRRRGVVLQHGSLFVGPAPDIAGCSSAPSNGRPPPGPNLLDFLPDGPGDLPNAIARHCSGAWSGRFEDDNLSPAENELASSLARDKYSTPRWTEIR